MRQAVILCERMRNPPPAGCRATSAGLWPVDRYPCNACLVEQSNRLLREIARFQRRERIPRADLIERSDQLIEELIRRYEVGEHFPPDRQPTNFDVVDSWKMFAWADANGLY